MHDSENRLRQRLHVEIGTHHQSQDHRTVDHEGPDRRDPFTTESRTLLFHIRLQTVRNSIHGFTYTTLGARKPLESERSNRLLGPTAV